MAECLLRLGDEGGLVGDDGERHGHRAADWMIEILR